MNTIPLIKWNVFDDIVRRKYQLIDRLNQGFIDRAKWQRFIADAEQAGCKAIAADMRERMEAS